MSTQWFTSDLHIDHKRIAEFRNIESLEEMNEKIFSMFDVVQKGDTVYILGDVSFTPEGAKRLFEMLLFKRKVADLHVIEGNHDSYWMKKLDELNDHPRLHIHQTMTLERQKPEGCRNVLFLSHYPQIIYNKSHYGAFQLHGHGHESTSDRPLLDNLVLGKRLNVNCELHDYKLWSREEIDEYMKNMPDNIDYYLCKGTEKQQNLVKQYLLKENIRLKDLYKKLGSIE